MNRIPVLLAFIAVSLGGFAQHTVANLRKVASGFTTFEIRSFEEQDSILYIKAEKYGMKPGEFYYMFVKAEGVDTIVKYTLDKEIKGVYRREWMRTFLKETEIADLDRSKVWTIYKGPVLNPKVNMGKYERKPFCWETAWKTYIKKHNLNKDGSEKREPTLEEMRTFIKVMSAVAAWMPLGEGRTLVDQLRNLPPYDE